MEFCKNYTSKIADQSSNYIDFIKKLWGIFGRSIFEETEQKINPYSKVSTHNQIIPNYLYER